MTWYCPDWAQNLAQGLNDFADGDSFNDVYADAQCSSFNRSGYFTSDQDDGLIDSEMDTESDADCNEHGRSAHWDSAYDIGDDLQAAGFYVCEGCETVYHTETALANHYDTNHDDDDEEPDHPDLINARGQVVGIWNFQTGEYRKPLTTSHSNWSLA